MMNLLPRCRRKAQENKFIKGDDFMEIGNIARVKEDVIIKTTNKKEKKNPVKNQGCIKMNDYFAF